MKVFIQTRSESVPLAIQQVSTALAPGLEFITSHQDADLLVLDTWNDVELMHSPWNWVILTGIDRPFISDGDRLPERTEFVPIYSFMRAFAARCAEVQAAVDHYPRPPYKKINGPDILVVDDRRVNALAAIEQLGELYQLTVVSTYRQALDELLARIAKTQFAAVLTDYLMPASAMTLGDAARVAFAGRQMPLGLIIAMRAIQAGVTKVAVVTDTSHHDHPMVAALDPLLNQPWRINDGIVRFWIGRNEREQKDWAGAWALLN